MSKYDKDEFEEQEMKKIRPSIWKWFDRLIFKYVMEKKPKIIRDKLKYKIINDFWALLIQKKKKERKRRAMTE